MKGLFDEKNHLLRLQRYFQIDVRFRKYLFKHVVSTLIFLSFFNFPVIHQSQENPHPELIVLVIF
jgi:hypothetical protein